MKSASRTALGRCLVAALLLGAPCAVAADAPAGLPAVVPAGDGVTVFIHGLEFRGALTFYRGPADSVRVTDGVRDSAVWPRPSPAPSPPNVERIRRIYGGVPFVKERTRADTDESWVRARDEFFEVRRRFAAEISAAYHDHLDAHPGDLAGARAETERAMAPYLVLFDDARGSFEWVGDDLDLRWAGLPEPELLLLHTGRFATDDPQTRPRILDDEAAATRIELIARHVASGSAGSCVVIVIGARGIHAASGCGPGTAESQIDGARRGESRDGPLTESEVEEIARRSFGKEVTK